MFNSNIKLKVIKYNNNNIYEQFVSSYHLILKYANVPYISGIEKILRQKKKKKKERTIEQRIFEKSLLYKV